MNYCTEKLDIIVVAGQSNAEGNGISLDNTIDVKNDVFELIDSNVFWFDMTDPNKPVLKLTVPVQCKVQCLQESFGDKTSRSSFCMSFVDEYKKSKFYDKNRKIMVVKAAIGGTGFYKKEWGLGCVLYERLLTMVDLALSFNSENRIVALLWHQGESDAFERPNVTINDRHDFYYEKFMEQTNDFINRYSQFDFPVIMGEFCNEWSNKPENFEKTQIIESALRECAKSLKKSSVVSSEGLTSNNEELSNGDDIHFSKPACIELGKRYFKAFENLEKK